VVLFGGTALARSLVPDPYPTDSYETGMPV
jgi:hypothetical protein